MKKHIKYPKIPQFRNVVSDINRKICFTGLDNDGNPIYDYGLKKPIINFNGTVKIHGTNASVCFNSHNGFWCQSRNNIITVDKDNAGFSAFAEERKVQLCELINQVVNNNQIDTNIYTVSIYGEWAGKGIQKGVGISQLEKAFYIFGCKISNPNDENFKPYWVDSSYLKDVKGKIFNVYGFQTYSVDVDFNMPQLSQNKFIEITESVEKECPISKSLGINNGLGEGVVWSATYKGESYRFKVKGEKHSVSRVKKLASVDTEKLNSINEFVMYAVTESRFNQAIDHVFNGADLDVKKMGDFLRWIINDIKEEESDVMKDNGLIPKDVNKYISSKAREMFFKFQNTFA